MDSPRWSTWSGFRAWRVLALRQYLSLIGKHPFFGIRTCISWRKVTWSSEWSRIFWWWWCVCRGLNGAFSFSVSLNVCCEPTLGPILRVISPVDMLINQSQFITLSHQYCITWILPVRAVHPLTFLLRRHFVRSRFHLVHRRFSVNQSLESNSRPMRIPRQPLHLEKPYLPC